MSRRLRKLTSVFLAVSAACILFSGCAGNKNGSQASPSPEVSGGEAGEFVLSLPFDPADPLNPLTGTNRINLTLGPLLYEGLFQLDRSFSPVPLLCESYTTLDNITFRFTLRTGVTFSDGSLLSAADAVYSLEQARTSSLYSERLSKVQSVKAEGEHTVIVTLNTADSAFPVLLDIPIIQNGTAGSSAPPGTGPYVLSSGDGESLVLRSDWWQGLPMPFDRIGLVEVRGSDLLIQDLGSNLIQLVSTDLTGTDAPMFSGNYDVTEYPTTILQYIGFNTEASSVFSNAAVRRAFGLGIDRDFIVTGLLSGHAQASALPVNPASPLYDSTLEEKYSYSEEAMFSALAEAGYTDSDEDGVLDANSGGREAAISATLLVNSESSFKVSMAEHIAASFSQYGIAIEVKKLAWEDYLTALEKGDFDLYLGEVKLTTDFNLTSLAATGGALNYGKFSDTKLDGLFASLAAAPYQNRGTIAAALYSTFCQQAPFIPICFKNQSVLTREGAYSGLEPTQQNVFYNLSAWTQGTSS